MWRDLVKKGGEKILDVDGQRAGGVLKIRQLSWALHVDRPL